MRGSIEVCLTAVKAQFRVAVAVRVAQFAAEMLRHILTDHTAGSEPRTESGARRTGCIANRSVVIKTKATCRANRPGLSKARAAADRQGHQHKVSPHLMSHLLSILFPNLAPGP